MSLVLGGFHLGGASRRRVERFIADLRGLGVRRAAPCHCTGYRSMEIFASEFSGDYIRNGVGLVITIGSEERRSE